MGLRPGGTRVPGPIAVPADGGRHPGGSLTRHCLAVNRRNVLCPFVPRYDVVIDELSMTDASNPDEQVRFGAVLRALRLRAGLSLNELARRADVDVAYVHRIEALGERQVVPRRPIVEALAHALSLAETERDDLLARAGYVPAAVASLGGWDATLAQVATVLLDDDLSPADKAEYREVVRLLSERWLGPGSRIPA